MKLGRILGKPLALPLLCACLFLAATAGEASQQDDANTALQRGDYATAFPLVLKMAQAGNVSAEVIVGNLYLTGNGTPQNLDEARNWLTKAADENNPDAENILGLVYKQGAGVERNDLSAWQWFEKAAKQNFPPGEFDAAAIHQEERLELQYDDPRLPDFLTASGSPLTPSQLASMRGKSTANYFDMTSKDAASLPWYQKAAAQGYAPAELNLAVLYLRGKATRYDPDAAMRLFSAAAQSTATDKLSRAASLFALLDLDIMYRVGWGVTPDAAKADELYKTAIGKGLEENPLYMNRMFAADGTGKADCKGFCVGTFRLGLGYFVLFNPR
jgi:hypothetical protein